MQNRVKFLVIAFVLLISTAACASPQTRKTPQELLLGEWVWIDGRHIHRFKADGTWAMDDSGLLDTNPDVMGTYSFDGETVSMVIGEGSRVCKIGDRWFWDVTSIDEVSLSGITVEDDCLPSGVGGEVTAVRCDPEKEITNNGCEPLDWDAFCEIALDQTKCN